MRERPAVAAVQLTSTGIAIVVLSGSDGADPTVVKLPLHANAAGRLEHETAILRAIHADRRLAGWRGLVPCPRATGILRGQHYRVENALPGASALESVRDPDRHEGLLTEAFEAVAVLHRSTAQAVCVDDDLAARWVDMQVDELVRRDSLRGSLHVRLERVREELHQALIGKMLSAGRIHGDFWSGNLLLGSSNPGPPALTGIVDWDASGALELSLHDSFHLLFSTRCLVRGSELGEVVREQLLNGRWAAHEHALLERHGGWLRDGALSERHTLLLYWLRHAAMHARQQSPRGGWRYRVWERRNVLSVLNAL
jgi:aminoglycoside phosphotransferase (APT) family kinase protein